MRQGGEKPGNRQIGHEREIALHAHDARRTARERRRSAETRSWSSRMCASEQSTSRASKRRIFFSL